MMTHSAIQESIEFASRMGPVKRLDIENHLDTDGKGLAGIGLLKRIVLHVKRVHLSKQNAPFLLLLLVELAITLFVAGIVVPSFLRFDVDTKGALIRGSLHSISMAGIAFSYTYENLGCAMLGMLTGAAAAFVIAYPSAEKIRKNIVQQAFKMIVPKYRASFR
jgi:ABC-type phosphate/phosphonate transport system permease subunit